jgi:hypothetical protein
MKNAGVLILFVGVLLLLYSGVSYVTRDKVVDLGSIEITKESRHIIAPDMYLGVGVLLVGGVVLAMSRRKSSVL